MRCSSVMAVRGLALVGLTVLATTTSACDLVAGLDTFSVGPPGGGGAGGSQASTGGGGQGGCGANCTPAKSTAWRVVGGVDDERALAIAALSSGDYVVAGQFVDAIDLASANPVADLRPHSWVASLDTDLAVVASYTTGTVDNNGDETIEAIAVDPLGTTVWAVGSVRGDVYFGPTPTSAAVDSDAFALRLTRGSDGALAFASVHTFDGLAGERANDVVLPSDGGPIMVGRYCGTFTFGTTLLPGTGGCDFFLGKLDVSGTPVWALSGGSNQEDEATRVALSDDGLFAVGGHHGAAFDGGDVMSHEGGRDVFVDLYDPSPSLLWRASFGSTEDDVLRGLCMHPDGDVMALVQHEGPIVAPAIPHQGGADLVLMRLAGATGAVLDVRALGNDANQQGGDLACAENGDVIVVGSNLGGSLSLGGSVFPHDGQSDAFAARYDDAFEHRWSRVLGGDDRQTLLGAVPDGDGAVVVGAFGGAVDFGLGSASAEALDALIIRLEP